MNIALIHYRIFETDGVSLEMEKWAHVLEEAGHQVVFIGGNEVAGHICIADLNYSQTDIRRLNRSCYESLEGYTEATLKEDIINRSRRFKDQMVSLIKERSLDLIIPNNIFSLGIHPHIAMGLYGAIVETGIQVIGHHHDFYFERAYYGQPTTEFVEEILNTYYPPKDLEQMGHVVINHLAQKALLEKKGLEATVVPNVFDFYREGWQTDDYNGDFRDYFGIAKNDIVMLQGTRVTNRKAIELAIDVVAEMNKLKLEGKTLYNGETFDQDSRIVLLAVGLHEGLEGYEDKLRQYAKDLSVPFIMDETVVATERSKAGGHKVYSLWDAYTGCDIISYPSIFEGWGNQFLEGLFAKKPMVIFEYTVYESDIKPFGFDVVSLGNDYKVDANGLAKVAANKVTAAAKECIQLLENKEAYNTMVEANFAKGKEHLSYKALSAILEGLIQ